MKRFLTLIATATTLATGFAANETGLVINEICTSNIDQWVDVSFNYGAWVEFYNPTSADINITDWYLSGDAQKLKLARVNQSTIVPAGGYKVVWFDNYHPRYSPKTLDMKLDLDGGTLYVSDNQGKLLLQQDYPAAVARCSWARTEDGGQSWRYCANPSKEFSNNDRKFAEERLAAPEVSCDSKVFESGTSMSMTVTIPEGCTLMYTTDGSAPTLSNGQVSTTGQFSNTGTTLYRFRLFRDGYLPSEVITRSTIRSTWDIDLPILSITSTHKNFYSDSIGIFVKGRMNGRPGRGQSAKCNWNMDWERPAVFEYFTADGDMLFNQEVGIERCGGWSRAWNPYSFKIKANRRYEGHKTLDFPFFAEKPFLKQKTLQIRNGGNDNSCRVRDPFLQEIVAVSGINVDYQAYQPVAHFINGEWKGTINMREPNNKHFVYANYGFDDDDIDQFEMSPDSGYVQNCGDDDAWKKLISYAKSANNPAWYEKVQELLDVESFCNYMAIEFYLRNWDWPQNNVKAWRPRREEDGRFRFVLFDLDGFDGTNAPFTTFANKQTYQFDYCYDVGKRYTKEIELVTLFTSLLSNQEFRKQFIDTFCLVAYSVFDPSLCKEMINEMANRVAPTQEQYNRSSPWDTANKLISALSANRQSQLMSQLKNYNKMGLTSKNYQTANVRADIDEARILFNGLPIPHGSFNGRYYAPLTLSVSAPAGYDFVGWKELKANSEELLNREGTWSYYDQGSLNNTGWQTLEYDDSAWPQGKAPMGYFTDGQRDYNTTLDYGTNRNQKRPTYYFRTHVTLNSAPSANDIITMDYKIDDGVIVYVNGEEAVRYNMPAGKVTYSMFSSTYAEGNPDEGSMNLPVNLFHEGDNLIAVELHNNNAQSTDVYWSAAISRSSYSGGEIVSTETSYTLPDEGNSSLIACFTPSEHQPVPVVINEVGAGNDVYVNEFQKKADWIELYNTTDHDIDLEGMFLTDRLDKPEKYQISANGTLASTIIPAHGYKIIWCDKQEGESQLHANFKLDNDEEMRHVMLTSADKSWSDTLSYNQHAGNESVGRYPDANRNVYLMTRPSINKTNELTQLSYAVEQHSPEAIERVLPDAVVDQYYVFDLSGRLVTTGNGAFRQNTLPSGVYVVKAGSQSYKVVIE